MVAHRSPKPPVRVRILLPLPNKNSLALAREFLFGILIGGFEKEVAKRRLCSARPTRRLKQSSRLFYRRGSPNPSTPAK